MEPNDFDYNTEYRQWGKMLLLENQYNLLNDLKYAYMTSFHYPHDFQPCDNLGSSIHYWIVDILKSKFEMNVALGYLDNLMTTEDGINLLHLSTLFSVNEFSNLYLKDGTKDSFHSSVCLKNMRNNWLLNLTSNSIEVMKKSIPQVQKSPCLELEKYPECKNFCVWFGSVLKFLAPLEILAMNRYKFSQHPKKDYSLCKSNSCFP